MSGVARLTVVGIGRGGSVVVRVAREAGVEVETVTRTAGQAALARAPREGAGTAPILVCTRADDLTAVIEATHPARRTDLVFVQNGMIVPLLARHGLQRATQGVLYFAATARDGVAAPGATSFFYGPHAAPIAALLNEAAIPAQAVPSWEAFAVEIGAKLCWNVIFGALCDRWDAPVGTVAAGHAEAVGHLASEIAPVVAHALEAPLEPAPLLARLLAYSEQIPSFRASVREFEWRNGWVAAHAATHGFSTPQHAALLGLLGQP